MKKLFAIIALFVFLGSVSVAPVAAMFDQNVKVVVLDKDPDKDPDKKSEKKTDTKDNKKIDNKTKKNDCETKAKSPCCNKSKG